MKTHDNYFSGFPAVWNLAAFYLYVLEPARMGRRRRCCSAGRLDLRYRSSFVHPLRVRRLRALNIALLVAWGALALMAVGTNLDPGPYVTAPLAAIAVYFLIAGVLRKA